MLGVHWISLFLLRCWKLIILNFQSSLEAIELEETSQALVIRLSHPREEMGGLAWLDLDFDLFVLFYVVEENIGWDSLGFPINLIMLLKVQPNFRIQAVGHSLFI